MVRAVLLSSVLEAQAAATRVLCTWALAHRLLEEVALCISPPEVVPAELVVLFRGLPDAAQAQLVVL